MKGSTIVYMYNYITKIRHHNSKHCDACRSYVKKPCDFCHYLTFVVHADDDVVTFVVGRRQLHVLWHLWRLSSRQGFSGMPNTMVMSKISAPFSLTKQDVTAFHWFIRIVFIGRALRDAEYNGEAENVVTSCFASKTGSDSISCRLLIHCSDQGVLKNSLLRLDSSQTRNLNIHTYKSNS